MDVESRIFPDAQMIATFLGQVFFDHAALVLDPRINA